MARITSDPRSRPGSRSCSTAREPAQRREARGHLIESAPVCRATTRPKRNPRFRRLQFGSPRTGRLIPRGIACYLLLHRALRPAGLETQTKWRWIQALANSSLRRIPCYAGKIRGILTKSDLTAQGRLFQLLEITRLSEAVTSNSVAGEQGIFFSEQGISRSKQGIADAADPTARLRPPRGHDRPKRGC